MPALIILTPHLPPGTRRYIIIKLSQNMFINENFRRIKSGKTLSAEFIMSCEEPDDLLFITGRYLMINASNRSERGRFEAVVSSLLKRKPHLLVEGNAIGWTEVFMEWKLTVEVGINHSKVVHDYIGNIIQYKPKLMYSALARFQKAGPSYEHIGSCVLQTYECSKQSKCGFLCPLKDFHEMYAMNTLIPISK